MTSKQLPSRWNPLRHLCSGLLSTGILCVFLNGCIAPKAASAPQWRCNGDKAWVSDSQGWRAIVSEDRARLIYLGPMDGDTNLLYAPAAPQAFRPRGGHIVWLGPQSEWSGKWGNWPPPEEWEQLPSRLVRVRGSWLDLTLPHPDKKIPQLKRSYRWHNGVLLCRVSWVGGHGDYQAVQILQLPTQATVRAKRLSETAPGFVRFDQKGKPQSQRSAIGEEITLLSGKIVRLHSETVPNKYGFLPQTLKARIGVYGLEMGRTDASGAIVNSPDHGFETQIYLGGKTFPFLEIEQLTPRLKTRNDAANEFTIWIKPRQYVPHPTLQAGQN